MGLDILGLDILGTTLHFGSNMKHQFQAEVDIQCIEDHIELYLVPQNGNVLCVLLTRGRRRRQSMSQ